MSSRSSSLLALLLWCCWFAAVTCQTYYPPASQGVFPPLPYRQMTTYDDTTAQQPAIDYVVSVAVDSRGLVYVAEYFDSRVQVLYPNHTQKAVISVSYPSAVAVDGADNLYIGTGDNTVVKLSPGGGSSTPLFTYATNISFAIAMVVDSAGVLYVANAAPGAPGVAVFYTNGTLRSAITDCAGCYVALSAARTTLYVSGDVGNTIGVYNTTTLNRTGQIHTDFEVLYLAATASDHFYVSTRNEYYISHCYELNSTGAVIADLSDLVISPLAIAVSPVNGQVYFCDFQRIQVLVLYPDTRTIATVYRSGLNSAGALALDAQGNLYVCAQSGVVVLYPNGTEKIVYEIDIGLCTGVVVTSDGTVYVSSYFYMYEPYGFITVFRPNGTLVAAYNLSDPYDNNAVGLAVDASTGTIYRLNSNAQIIVLAANGTTVAIYSTNYTDAYGLARAPNGNLYYGSYYNRTIVVLNSRGVQTAAYDLSAYDVVATGLTLDTVGNLYISDDGNDRVVVMNSTTGAVKGQYLINPYFYGLLGVAVSAQGLIYVGDNTNVVVLQPATGQSVTINLATGFATADYSTQLSITDGAQDVNWRVGSSQSASQVVGSNGVDFNPIWLPYGANGPTSSWIALSASSLTANAAQLSYNFTRTFTMPAAVDTTTLTLTGRVSCDKSCSLYLNNQLLVSVPENDGYTNYYRTAFTATPAQLVLGGRNTLTIILSTVNLTGPDDGIQYNAVRLEGYVNAILTSSVLGDPQLVGLRGQSYQVHGIDGAVYNLISDRMVQLNTRFGYLTGGECLRDAMGRKLFTCWTHPGSYLTELVLLTNGGGALHIVAGAADKGFAVVRVDTSSTDDGHALAVGDSASLQVMEDDGSVMTASISYTNLRTVTITQAGLYSLTVENSDGFLNVLSLTVSDMHRLTTDVRSHGLIGQTWNGRTKGVEVRDVEGYVDDYSEGSGDLRGCGFVYNKFSC